MARTHVEHIYRELERDPAVVGVGVTAVPGAKPKVIVPKAEFAERAGHGVIREETVRKRIVPTTARLALIKPALVEGDRKWSFKSADGEFGYTMKDADFLRRVLSGVERVPMVAGIEIDADVETSEEFKNGVWVVTDRAIVFVRQLHRPLRQAGLSLGPNYDDEPPEDQ